jgi:S1/P1 Nuclease
VPCLTFLPRLGWFGAYKAIVHCPSGPHPRHASIRSCCYNRLGQPSPRVSLGCGRCVSPHSVPDLNILILKQTSGTKPGHEIVAVIAQSYLDPQVLKSVCSILAEDDQAQAPQRGAAPCYLSSVATWADKIRFHARWSAPLHFINGNGDHPPKDCRFPGPDGWGGKERANVLDAIHNVSSILTDFVQGSSSAAGAPESAQEALKFLIHFVGDMHQPLHLCGRDRGGNSDKVHWDNRVTSACTFRTSILVHRFLTAVARPRGRLFCL